MRDALCLLVSRTFKIYLDDIEPSPISSNRLDFTAVIDGTAYTRKCCSAGMGLGGTQCRKIKCCCAERSCK